MIDFITAAHVKWLLKETAKQDKNNKPMCPDCNIYVKTKSRNAKFRKENK